MSANLLGRRLLLQPHSVARYSCCFEYVEVRRGYFCRPCPQQFLRLLLSVSCGGNFKCSSQYGIRTLQPVFALVLYASNFSDPATMAPSLYLLVFSLSPRVHCRLAFVSGNHNMIPTNVSDFGPLAEEELHQKQCLNGALPRKTIL